MKAITLWQPWATLIASRVKVHETRTWGTHYRGPILIHAAQHWTLREAKLCYSEPFFTVLHAAGVKFPARCNGLRLPTFLPLTVIVAVADVVDCLPTTPKLLATQRAEPADSFDRAFGDWGPGRFAWRLENVRPLANPVGCLGAQGLWTPPARIVDAVMGQLGQAVAP